MLKLQMLPWRSFNIVHVLVDTVTTECGKLTLQIHVMSKVGTPHCCVTTESYRGPWTTDQAWLGDAAVSSIWRSL
eukprot:5624587-Pleurochrysis_carterae.AAC.8